MCLYDVNIIDCFTTNIYFNRIFVHHFLRCGYIQLHATKNVDAYIEKGDSYSII